jgi:hypothetical protein
MVIDAINYKAVWAWLNAVWAKSFIAILTFLIGLWIGTVQTESRIAGDCKFANAFRVDIQAFACQRKL